MISNATSSAEQALCALKYNEDVLLFEKIEFLITLI